LVVTDDQIQQRFMITTPLLSPEVLRYLQVQWPQPSFERFSGAFCYVTLRYRGYHTIYFYPQEGSGEYNIHFWPLRAYDFGRTIYLDDMVIFPDVTKEQLSKLENKEIVVLGRLISHPRRIPSERGYAIVAEIFGYLNESGVLNWVSIAELGNGKKL
jgi:hypothetical protein